jgi:cell division GTPase FtsZ
MKLVVLGFGQCGGRIADELARLNKRARTYRGIEIITGAYAINTDVADLSGLSTIKPDYQHRILIGGRKTGGHGVGKINELGAEIAREDSDKIIEAIRTTKRLFESDAFLLIASSGGGTGSGAIPIMTQLIKERYGDKPVYDVIVLPFEHEEQNEERAVYNSAVCLKSVSSVADATILIDNQRYIRKDSSLRNNLSLINQLIAEPFYNLLCAGEEKKGKHIGAKTLDAGDIIQTLSGWTVLGYGQTLLPVFSPLFKLRRQNFKNKSTETFNGMQAMDAAISELSMKCNTQDANRAMYLITAPAKETNMDLIKELADYLRELAPKAVIRSGDYPRKRGKLDVTVILSELDTVEKVKNYYDKSSTLIPVVQDRQEEIKDKLKEMDEASKDIPTLL